MNVTTKTRKIRKEWVFNIVRASVNIAVQHSLPCSSLKLAPKLKPAQILLQLLSHYLQGHITNNTKTMLNLFDDVKKK